MADTRMISIQNERVQSIFSDLQRGKVSGYIEKAVIFYEDNKDLLAEYQAYKMFYELMNKPQVQGQMPVVNGVQTSIQSCISDLTEL